MEQRLINANELEANMYHEAFETDTDMQKWDSGCWIRYKMFENQIEKMPTVDAVEVVRCKDCKWWKTNYMWNGSERKVCVVEAYEPVRNEDDYCAKGERKENEMR